MKKLQHFLTVIAFVAITSFISSCGSNDSPSNNASIVGEWKLDNFSFNADSYIGDVLLVTFETEGVGDNCIYTFNENPNILEVSGKANVTVKGYQNGVLTGTDSQTIDYDANPIDPTSWEISGNEIILNNEIILLPEDTSGEIVSNTVVYTITTLTETNLVIEFSGTVVSIVQGNNVIDDITYTTVINNGVYNFTRN